MTRNVHPHPVPEKSGETLNRQAKRGIKIMMSRQAFTQVFTFSAGVVLARHVSPAEFGLYAIATFIVNTLALFGSFGFAASLVQRREDVEVEDLTVAFTLQFAAVAAMVLVCLVSASYLEHFYRRAPPGLGWLIRAVSLNLMLSVWKTMGEFQLERRLAFDVIARIEVAETLVFQGLAVSLAVCGFGVWSLAIALVVRGIVGAALTYKMAPWPLRFVYDKEIALRLLRYGVPYQLQSLMNSVGSWVTPLFVGPLIGSYAVGLLNWSSANGKKPLMLVDAVMRVSFPHFARLQDNPAEVEEAMRNYMTGLLIPAFLWFTVLFACADAMVPFVYTSRWSSGVPALKLCALALPLDCIAWLVAQTQSALGRVKLILQLLAVRSALMVGLGCAFVYWIGFQGVPVAYLISFAATTPLAFREMPKGTMMRTLGPQIWLVLPTLAGCAVGVASRLAVGGLAKQALLSATASGGAFLLVAWFTCPSHIRAVTRARCTAGFFRQAG